MTEWERLLPLRRLSRRGGGNWVAATNAGLREARGEYACFLHQDDIWLPGRLAAMRTEAARRPTLILHPALFIGPQGRRLGTWRCPLPAGDVDSRLFVERLIVQNFIAIPTPVFAREAALGDGGLEESLWFTADWDLWFRLGRRQGIRYLTSPLAGFRVHRESQTMVRNDLADRRRQYEAVVERPPAGPKPPRDPKSTRRREERRTILDCGGVSTNSSFSTRLTDWISRRQGWIATGGMIR